VSTTTPASADLQEFIDDLHEKIKGHATRSDTEPFLELWSHSPDASIMAAVGGYHVGFDEVGKLLRWVSERLSFDTYTAETLSTHAGDDLAASVELEHFTNLAEGQEMTLRVTHLYRTEGAGWKLLHRHAETLTPVDETLPTNASS
jgi:ketosteroid isomerase-like protein